MNNQASVSEIKAQCVEWRDSGKLTVCFVRVWWSRNDRTGEIEIHASLGCAPDEHTIILYPIGIYKWGYWNKTHARREMNAAKRELFAAMVVEGYTKQHLTQPVEEKSLDYF